MDPMDSIPRVDASSAERPHKRACGGGAAIDASDNPLTPPTIPSKSLSPSTATTTLSPYVYILMTYGSNLTPHQASPPTLGGAIIANPESSESALHMLACGCCDAGLHTSPHITLHTTIGDSKSLLWRCTGCQKEMCGGRDCPSTGQWLRGMLAENETEGTVTCSACGISVTDNIVNTCDKNMTSFLSNYNPNQHSSRKPFGHVPSIMMQTQEDGRGGQAGGQAAGALTKKSPNAVIKTGGISPETRVTPNWNAHFDDAFKMVMQSLSGTSLARGIDRIVCRDLVGFLVARAGLQHYPYPCSVAIYILRLIIAVGWKIDVPIRTPDHANLCKVVGAALWKIDKQLQDLGVGFSMTDYDQVHMEASRNYVNASLPASNGTCNFASIVAREILEERQFEVDVSPRSAYSALCALSCAPGTVGAAALVRFAKSRGPGSPGAGSPGAGSPGAGSPGAGSPGAGSPGAGSLGLGTVAAAAAAPFLLGADDLCAESLAGNNMRNARRRVMQPCDTRSPCAEQIKGAAKGMTFIVEGTNGGTASSNPRLSRDRTSTVSDETFMVVLLHLAASLLLNTVDAHFHPTRNPMVILKCSNPAQCGFAGSCTTSHNCLDHWAGVAVAAAMARAAVGPPGQQGAMTTSQWTTHMLPKFWEMWDMHGATITKSINQMERPLKPLDLHTLLDDLLRQHST
jgi:hypothetical protein